MKKKAQIDFLNKLYDDLVLFEEEGGKHDKDEIRYLRNAQNSVEVCISQKKNKNKKKKDWHE